MRALFAAVLVTLLLPLAARAHVGSPNVFFEGRAGPNALNVVIRPPLTLPGVAQIDVRVADADATHVSVQAVFVDERAEAVPAATPATAVAGDSRLFSAGVWLLRRGSYGVRISVESPRGSGTVAIPLQAAALQRPVMPPALGGLLVALGALLFVWATWLVAAAAGSRRATVAAVVVLGAALQGGNLRWRTMDQSFNNALSRPLPVQASVERGTERHLLRLAPVASGAPESTWETLVTDHGKLMHLFLIRENDLDVFAHLHPVRRDGQTFEGVLPSLPAGSYELYAELTYESGSSQTLVAKLDLPEPAGAAQGTGQPGESDGWCRSGVALAASSPEPSALDFDDAWHLGRVPAARASPLMGGGRMVFETPGELVADREVALRFSAFTRAGEPEVLEPYMGMLGHAVVRRSDGSVFTHLHPVGTISMAAAELLARSGGSTEPMPTLAPGAASEVVFPYAFPRAGEYRVWVQVRTRASGGVLTGVFDLHVGDR
jgi:hypothetical protein